RRAHRSAIQASGQDVILSRRALLGALVTMPLACQRTANGPIGTGDDDYELLDLSHALSPSSPYIHVKNATFAFERTPIATIAGRGVYANAWRLTEHIGTHIDAPCHFAERARCLDSIPLADLSAEAVVLDLRSRARENPDAELTLDDLADWEARHGALPPRCAVLMSSGWDERWPSQERFTNADARGTAHFPGFSRALIA